VLIRADDSFFDRLWDRAAYPVKANTLGGGYSSAKLKAHSGRLSHFLFLFLKGPEREPRDLLRSTSQPIYHAFGEVGRISFLFRIFHFAEQLTLAGENYGKTLYISFLSFTL
jgi:hypothetical protein